MAYDLQVRAKVQPLTLVLMMAVSCLITWTPPVSAQDRQRVISPRVDNLRVAPRPEMNFNRVSPQIREAPSIRPSIIVGKPRTPQSAVIPKPPGPTTQRSAIPGTPNRPATLQTPIGASSATGGSTYQKSSVTQQRAKGAYQYLCRTDRKQCWVNTKTQFPLYSRCSCGDYSGVTIAER